MSILKDNLVLLMKSTGTTSKDLAAAVGVKAEFIEGISSGGIDIESADELAPVKAINNIARHYGVTIDNLVNTQLTPVTIFAPKTVVDEYRKNPALGKGLMERVSAYGAPTIRDIGASLHASWGESIATSVSSGATSGVAAGVVAYSVAGPTPAPGPE